MMVTDRHREARALVSIVIATCNSRLDHLSVAISSALAQTWHELEILVCDDSSDDRLRAFVAGFDDARLQYRHNVPARGVAVNHWSAFADARGAYIAVLNHDDWLAPHFVERLATVLEQTPEAVLAFCDHWIIDVRGRRLDEASDRNTEAWGRQGLAEGVHRPFVHLVGAQSIPMAMGALFRRSALPAELPAQAGAAYDLWLAYLLCRGDGACYLRERMSAWRTHSENLTSGGSLDWLHGAALCWQAMLANPLFAPVRSEARRKAALGFYACATRSWAGGRRVDCLRHAMRSLAIAPTVKSALACLLPLLPTRFAPSHWGRGAGLTREPA